MFVYIHCNLYKYLFFFSFSFFFFKVCKTGPRSASSLLPDFDGIGRNDESVAKSTLLFSPLASDHFFFCHFGW